MSTPFLGSLMLVPFNFAPKGFALCNGQLLAVSQNQALFSLLGTVYGGNGSTTFGLPNLQGRIAVSTGQGQGLSSYVLGQASGTESITLLGTQIPPHTHNLVFSSASTGTGASPLNNWPGTGSTTPPNSPYNASSTGNAMASGTILPVGGSPHENRQPFLVLNWVIALTGIFPSRS